MSRTQVPEEDQRVSTVSDLKNYEPRPKAIIRTEGKNAPNDKLENLYWWDPDGEASNADGDEIIESNVSGYGNGEIDEGVWRRFVSPMSEARNQIDLKDTSSVTREAGYSLLSARYTGKNFDWYNAAGSDLALPRDLLFNGDGTKMYLIGTTNDIIEEYSLSAPYDISTGSFTARVSTANDFDWSSYGGAGEDPLAADFVNGGSGLFFISSDANLDGGQGAVQKISLSTAYDLSSTTTADGGVILSNIPNSIEFHPNDGSRFFSGDANGEIEEYSLDAGTFDLSGGVSKVNVLDISSNVADPRSFTFNDDGRAFFTTGASSDKVYKFELRSAYDITSSATLTETFDITEVMEFPEFITFNGDGSNFFLGYSSTGKYYEWESTVSRIDVRNTLSGGDGINFDSENGEISNKFADGNGNLGVGTNSPDNNLHVNGNKTDVVKFTHNNSSSDSAHLNLLSGSSGTARIGLGSGTNTDQALFDFDANNKEINIGTNLGQGDIAFYSGSFNEKARITSSGKIGVGTDSPSRKFSVDAGASDAVAAEFSTSEDRAYIDVNNQDGSKGTGVRHIVDGSVKWVVGVHNSNNNNFEIGNNGNINSTNDFVIDTSGNVGVGTNSPSENLDVQGNAILEAASTPSLKISDKDSNTYARVTSDYQGSVILSADPLDNRGDDGVVFKTNGTEKARIDENGKLGVGVASPSTKIEASGDITVDNIIQKGGQLPQVYRETRSIPGTVDDYVEIGNFVTNYGGHSIKVNITVSAYGFSTAKQYLIPIKTGQTSGNWRKVLPISENVYTSSGTDQNFSLQIKSDGDYAYLRIRKSSGTNSRDATITIQQLGLTGDSFTSQNGTGSTSEKPVFSGTVITQKDSKVGIGTDSPDHALHVETKSGDVAVLIESSNNPYTWLSFVDPNSTSDTHTLIGNEGDDLLFRSGNNETMRIDAAGQVGIGKSSPSKALDVAGQVTMDDSYIRNLSNISSDTTTSGDDFYSVDTSGGSVTLTLSSSDAETGRVIHVKRNGTQRVDIVTESSETIDGRSSAQLGSDEESVRLVYNGANSDWEVY